MLHYLSIQNFGPFESIKVGPDIGLTNCVVGRNGIGKSALLNALGWCISGLARRGDGKSEGEDDLIRNGTATMQVVTILVGRDGVIVEIERSRTRGRASTLVVRCSGEEWTGKRAQAEIWERIGVSADGFSEIVHVSQGRVSQIADAGDGQRREILLSWLGDAIAVWDRGRAEIASRRRTARREVVRIRSQISTLSEQLAEMMARLNGNDGRISDYSSDDTILQTVDTRLSELRREAGELTRKRQESRARVERLVEFKRALERAHSQLQALGDESPLPEVGDVSSERDRLSVLSEKRASIKRVGTGSGATICPLVGEQCPSADWVSSSRVAREHEIERLDSEIVPLQRMIDTHRQRALERSRIEKRNQSTLRQRLSLEAEIGRLTAESNRLEALSANGSNGWNEDAAVKRLETIRLVINELQTRRDDAIRRQQLVSETRSLEERVSGLRVGLATAERELRLCTETLIAIDQTTGPAALAEARIQDRVNAVLEPMGWKLSLEWYRATTKRVTECEGCGETCRTNRRTCPSCGEDRAVVMTPDLRLVFDDGRTVRDLRHASGGQRQFVSLALRLATTPIPFLILDEVDSAIGEPLDTLAALMLANSGIQTLVVSHGFEMPAVADTVLMVGSDPESGYSVVEVTRRER